MELQSCRTEAEIRALRKPLFLRITTWASILAGAVALTAGIVQLSEAIHKQRKAELDEKLAEIKKEQAAKALAELETRATAMESRIAMGEKREKELEDRVAAREKRVKELEDIIAPLQSKLEFELAKPPDVRDFTGIYHAIVTLTDMTRAVTQKPEYRQRIVQFADNAGQAFPRLLDRVAVLKKWVATPRR